MKRKVFSFILSLVMLFTCASSAMAAELGNISAGSMILEEEVAERTYSVLQFMEPEKALYGLADIDFSTLYLGEQIPAYIVGDAGVVVETNILYYPIMSGSEWVATAVVTTDSAGKVNVQISTEYAKTYKEEGASGEVALIFDDAAAYIATEQEVLMSAVAPNEIPDRESLKSYTGTMNIDKTELVADRVISGESTYSMQSFDNQYYLQVPCVQQAENSLQCWAACIASIRGYYGTTTTIDDVYEKAMEDKNLGVYKYCGADIYTAAAVLEDYGFSLTWRWDGSYNWYQLRLAIYLNETPIYTGCSYSTTSGHAVVIRGFYVYQNISEVGIISYMDPATGTYVASSVATDGDFYYVPSGSSAQYTMSVFLEVGE